MKIVVTIPAFNEEKSIGAVIEELHAAFKKEKLTYEILVVDDGSTDGTVAAARKAGATVTSHPRNAGLAETFRTEMKQCLARKADIIVHTDADGQYRAEDAVALVRKVREGYDLVLGSRFKGRIEHMPFLNRIGNRMFTMLVRYVVKAPVSDAQTGLRAFNREVAALPVISTYTYTQEQIIRAVKSKMRIAEVPIHFARRDGKSRLIRHPLNYAVKGGVNVIRVLRDYTPLTFFGAMGAVFLFFGTGVGIWLVYRFLTEGVVGRLPSAMLSVLLISIGLQIVLFGFLADMFRKN
jgi:glycosyltransferase involved in cell wall biosynthesis